MTTKSRLEKRKDASVQHVRIRHHDMACLADGGAAPGCGVAVIRIDAYVDREAELEGAQLRELVLSQGLGRVHIERAPLGMLEQPLQNREVVAERLAAGGRRNHDEVAAVANRVIGVGLVRI